MRSVQLTNHQIHDALHFIGCAAASYIRSIDVMQACPVLAVKLGIVELPVQNGPALLERSHLVRVEIDVKRGGNGDSSRSSRLQLHRVHVAIIEKVNGLRICAELIVGFRAWRKRKLLRYGRLGCEFIQGIRIKLFMVASGSREDQQFAIRADDRFAHIKTEWNKSQT